jgi:hypothetical protein
MERDNKLPPLRSIFFQPGTRTLKLLKLQSTSLHLSCKPALALLKRLFVPQCLPSWLLLFALLCLSTAGKDMV